MSSPDPCDDPFVSDSDIAWDPYADTQSQEHTQVNEVRSTQVADQDSDANDDQLTLRYSIDWKVRVNNRSILQDTAQDVTLIPGVYWERHLRTDLETAVRDCERRRNKFLKSEGGSIVVSVSKRGQKPVTKPFQDKDIINWPIIEKQLLKWREFFNEGKTLSLELTFNYVEDSQPPSTTSRGRNNRGRPSRTQRMLADGDVLQAAEEGSSELLAIWKELFEIFRCPGDHCSKGPHCWIDPNDGKHYPLTRYYMRSLIKLAQEGHPIRGHDDVPQDIRNQLYAVERQLIERRQKASNHATAPETSAPNIKITNVMPSASPLLGPSQTTTPEMPQVNHLDDIPGSRDENMKEYCTWQQSRHPSRKKDYETAYDVMMERGLDLETIHLDPHLFTILTEEKNITIGSAFHVLGDIDHWAGLKRKRAEAEEDREDHRKRRG